VTAFVQAPQGNLGPGFVSISNAFASRSMNKYLRTSTHDLKQNKKKVSTSGQA
jgi:hypothetical protein